MPAVAASLRVHISSLAALPRKSLLRPLKPLVTPSVARLLVAPPSASSRSAVVAMAAEPRGPHSYADIESTLEGEPLIELLPSWARRTICPAGSGCGDGECELLHVDPTWRDALASRHMAHGVQSSGGSAWGGRPRLIVCAGPERSGSTWLFNAVRLLLALSGQLALTYWLHSISASKLRARGLSPLGRPDPGGKGGGHGGMGGERRGSAEGFGKRGDGEGVGMDGEGWGGVNVVVKTHEWAEGWEVGEWSGVVLLTERDTFITFTQISFGIFRLSSPLAAASRLMCATPFIYSTTPAVRPSLPSTLVSAIPPSSPPYFSSHALPQSHQGHPRIKAHMQSYLRDHYRWKQHAAAVIPLASIVPPGSPSELLCLSHLAALLGLQTVEGAAAGAAEGSGLEAIQTLEGREGAGGRAVDVRVVSRALAQLPVPTVPTVSLYFHPSSHVLLQPHPSPPNFLVGCSPPSNLPPTLTAGCSPDPVTKLWPRHKSKGGSARALTGEERAELQQFVASLAPPASAPTK
ncbi:unnamed protein product [Closterium sp. NIES-65]|nr:unnamed protein product [Closterium sp. NIES-65]